MPRRRPLGIWDELGYIGVKLCECLVKGGEPGCVCPRELGQVSVGHLAMADDALSRYIGIRDVIGPEFMPRIGGGAGEDLSCRAGRLAFADEQP